MPTPRTSAAACAAILSVGIPLTGCAAFANEAATESATSATETSVTAPRTEAVTAAPTPPPSTTKILPVGDVSLGIDDRGDLGEILVDATGRAVYAFSADSANTPTCYDACANTWLPILTDSDPAGGIGIDVAAAGTVPRRDGGEQVTYYGIPLYRYAGDKTDADAKGQGLNMFGGEWHVLTKTGAPLA